LEEWARIIWNNLKYNFRDIRKLDLLYTGFMMNEKNREFLKMLGGTFAVVVSGVWYLSVHLHSMSTAFSDELHSMSDELHAMELRLSEKISSIDKRLTVVETVLVLQGHPIKGLAAQEDK
jgi:hypothetical protein